MQKWLRTNKQTNGRTDKRTGQTLSAPDISMRGGGGGGHKNWQEVVANYQVMYMYIKNQGPYSPTILMNVLGLVLRILLY